MQDLALEQSPVLLYHLPLCDAPQLSRLEVNLYQVQEDQVFMHYTIH